MKAVHELPHSKTMHVEEKDVIQTDALKALYAGISQHACQDQEDAAKNISDFLTTSQQSKSLRLIDLLDAVPSESLYEFYEACKTSATKHTFPPMLKLYLHYGQGKDGYNFGVNAFILPPGCNGSIHNHKAETPGDPCISYMVNGRVKESHYVNRTDEHAPSEEKKFALKFEKLERSSKIQPITVIRGGQPMGIGDTHKLRNAAKNGGALAMFVAALDAYISYREKNQKISDKTNADLERNTACSLHPYLGLNAHDMQSSVKRCDFSKIPVAKDRKPGLRQELKQLTETRNFSMVETILKREAETGAALGK